MAQAPLRSFEDYKKSIKSFEWFGDKIPGASDLDCFCHAHGKTTDSFIIFEGKQPGQQVPLGQKIAFDALRKLPNFEVVIVWGPDKQGNFVLGGSWHGKVTAEELGDLLEDWWTTKKAL